MSEHLEHHHDHCAGGASRTSRCLTSGETVSVIVYGLLFLTFWFHSSPKG